MSQHEDLGRSLQSLGRQLREIASEEMSALAKQIQTSLPPPEKLSSMGAQIRQAASEKRIDAVIEQVKDFVPPSEELESMAQSMREMVDESKPDVAEGGRLLAIKLEELAQYLKEHVDD